MNNGVTSKIFQKKKNILTTKAKNQKFTFQFGQPQNSLHGFHEVWEVTSTFLLLQLHFIQSTKKEVNDEDDCTPLEDPNDSSRSPSLKRHSTTIENYDYNNGAMSMAMSCNHLFYYVSVLGLKKKKLSRIGFY